MASTHDEQSVPSIDPTQSSEVQPQSTLAPSEKYQPTHRIMFTLSDAGSYESRVTNYDTGQGYPKCPASEDDQKVIELSRSFARSTKGRATTWGDLADLVNKHNGPNDRLANPSFKGPLWQSVGKWRPGDARPDAPEIFELVVRRTVDKCVEYPN